MAQQDDKFAKILFRFYSDILDEWTVETINDYLLKLIIKLLPLSTLVSTWMVPLCDSMIE